MLLRFLRIVLSFASVFAAAGFSARLDAAPSVTGTTKMVSDSVFRGLRVSGAALQPAVDLTASDFFAGISSTVPLENRTSEQPGAELDVYGSYRFALSSTTHLTPGFTTYFFRHAPARSGYRRAIVEPSLALSHTLAAVRLTSTVYYDLMRKGPALDLTADAALPLTKLGTELDLALSVGGYRLRNAADAVPSRTRSNGNYWSFSAVVPFQITFASKIQLGLTYAAAFDTEIKTATSVRNNPLATQRWVAQLGYSLLF